MTTKTLTVSKLDCAPALTAKLAPWMHRFIEQPELGQRLIQSADSPVHVVVTSEFEINVAALMSVLTDRGMAGGLFFARKANKLPWFVSQAKEEGAGVDTASLNELRETLDLGVDPGSIIVTAIGKSEELVSLAASKGCLLVIDNADEIDMIGATAQRLGGTARVGVRFAGFNVKGRKVFSRFGLPIDDASTILAKIDADSHLKLELLHAHLDRYDTEERAWAARQLLQVADHAQANGRKIDAIDLGGGILIRYLEQEQQWNAFLEALVDSVAGHRPRFTYMGDGFGYYAAAGEVAGTADLYPVWNQLSKERFLGAILDQSEGGTPLHKEITGRGLKLYFEPGRALLDNVGVTLAPVTFRKRDTLGNLLIGLGMNRTNLRPFRAEFCVDPILLGAEKRTRIDEGMFLVGNLCGEGDIIMRRKLDLGRMPEPGDIFCFPNTAGYLAHHLEVGTHGSGLPANILIDEETWQVRDTHSN
jgi:diaminopimelate decarboxylase